MKRSLLAIELQNDPFPQERVKELSALAGKMMNLDSDVENYYVYTESVSNLAYAADEPEVKILLKNGGIADISEVSDMFDHRFISERITKYFLCYPKECK